MAKKIVFLHTLMLEATLASGRQAVSLTEWKEDERLLCARLTPPPVPPWLLDSSDRLRHMLTNCSAWQTYSKLCSEDLKAHYPTLWTITDMDSLHKTNNIQWIPTIVILALAGILILAVICGYILWHRHDGFCSFRSWRRVKYQKQMTPSTSRDYCSPGMSLTPSVTVETQLSLWALEDQTPFNIDAPFTLDADPSLAILTSTPFTSCWSLSKSESRSSDTAEVLLQPQQLAGTQIPLVDVLPHSSVRGHPLDTYPSLDSPHDRDMDNDETERYCELPVRNKNRNSLTNQEWDETDCDSQHSSQKELISGKGNNMKSSKPGRALLKSCQNAGTKFVNKLSRQPKVGKTSQKLNPKQKVGASITRLRQSLSDTKLSRHHSSHNQKSSLDQLCSSKDTRMNSSTNGILSRNSRCDENIMMNHVSSSKSGVNSNSNSSTAMASAHTEGIYSYASNIPCNSSTTVKTKWPSNPFSKRSRFLKNHKFFSKS